MPEAVSGAITSGGNSFDTRISADNTKFDEDFTNFLQLLTTQLTNQDPTEPLDTNEMTNQLVAFSNVEQQLRQSDLLERLVNQNTGNSLMEASSIVGKNVEIFGNKVIVSEGETDVSATLVYAHPGDVKDTKITIYDSLGNTINEYEGIDASGKHEFIWDGKNAAGEMVPPGSYNVVVEEQTFSDEEFQQIATNIVSKVKEILQLDNEIYVNVGDFTVPFSDVLAVSEPNDTI